MCCLYYRYGKDVLKNAKTCVVIEDVLKRPTCVPRYMYMYWVHVVKARWRTATTNTNTNQTEDRDSRIPTGRERYGRLYV